MKLLALLSVLVFSAVGMSEEMPLPKNVITVNKPVINGLPILAVTAAAFNKEAKDPASVDSSEIALRQARLLCRFSGYMRVYTYVLRPLVEETSRVLVIDAGLTATPVTTRAITEVSEDGETTKVFYPAVFDKISCVK